MGALGMHWRARRRAMGALGMPWRARRRAMGALGMPWRARRRAMARPRHALARAAPCHGAPSACLGARIAVPWRAHGRLGARGAVSWAPSACL